MATPVRGRFYSDLAVGEKEDVTDDLVQAVYSSTPFLNSIGFGNAQPFKNLTHSYLDDALQWMVTTLNGGISAAATTITLAAAVAVAGAYIEIDGETIKLGATTDGLTFTGCVRSIGTVAAAAHLTGVQVVVGAKPEQQGDDAGEATPSYEPRSNTNYGQTFREVIDVPVESMQMDRYGRPGTPYDDQLRQKMGILKIKIEEAMLKGTAVAPVPSSGTKGMLGGLIEAVIGTNHTNMAGAHLQQSHLRTAVEAISGFYDPEEQINAVMLVPLRETFIFDGWQQAHIAIPPGDPLVQKYGVHVRRLQIGPMIIDVIPHKRLNNLGVLYQPKYCKPKVYIPMTHEPLSITGLARRGQIYGNWTGEWPVPEAHYIFSALATS